MKQISFEHIVLVSAVSWLLVCPEACLAGQFTASARVQLTDGTLEQSFGNSVGENAMATATEDEDYSVEGQNEQASARANATSRRGRIRTSAVTNASVGEFEFSGSDAFAEASYTGFFTPQARDSSDNLLPGNISFRAAFQFDGQLTASNTSPPGFDSSQARVEIETIMRGGGLLYINSVFSQVSTVTGETGTPVNSFFVDAQIPNNSELEIFLKITVSANTQAVNDGTGSATAIFGNSLFWDGITNVQHTGGLEVASFSAPGEGFDWANSVAIIPEPSTATLAGLALVGLAARSRRRRQRAE